LADMPTTTTATMPTVSITEGRPTTYTPMTNAPPSQQGIGLMGEPPKEPAAVAQPTPVVGQPVLRSVSAPTPQPVFRSVSAPQQPAPVTSTRSSR
jgi:hypothetical protein